jgi:hypothetical protein
MLLFLRYYPPAKIIALRSNIMKFSPFDNEHVAQAWERIKSMIKNCPTHGLMLVAWKITSPLETPRGRCDEYSS